MAEVSTAMQGDTPLYLEHIVIEKYLYLKHVVGLIEKFCVIVQRLCVYNHIYILSPQMQLSNDIDFVYNILIY